MRAARLALASLIVGISPGLAAEDPRNSFSYGPPDRAPPGKLTRYVEHPADRVIPAIEEVLREQRLDIESIDPVSRVVVARYSGDGRAYVDCGTVEMLIEGRRQRPPKRYSANRPDARTYRAGEGRRVGLYREMVLDARLVVHAEPSGAGTQITAESVYVTTKSVYHVLKGGDVGMLADREIISFKSTEVGRFDKGTRCVATGKLEGLSTLPFRSAT